MSEFDLDIRITEGPQGAAEPAQLTEVGPCTYTCWTFCVCTYVNCPRPSDDCTEVTCASECATCWLGVRGAGPQCI